MTRIQNIPPAELTAWRKNLRRELLARRMAVPAERLQTWRTAMDRHLQYGFPGLAKGVVAFWRHVEVNRKRPLRLMAALGLATILRFVTGRLDLAHALGTLGKRCGARLGVVRLPYAQAAIDVDKPSDLALVTRILG